MTARGMEKTDYKKELIRKKKKTGKIIPII